MTESRVRAGLRDLIKLTLGLIVLGMVVWALAPSLTELRNQVELRPTYVALGFAATLLATIVTAARWKLLTEAMGGTPLGYGVYFHYLALTRVLGHFSSTLLMDVVGRGVALRAAGNERDLGHLATPVVVERLLDVVLPAVLVGWVVIAAAANAPTWGSFAAVMLGFGVLAALTLRPMVAAATAVYGWLRSRGRVADPLRVEPIAPTLAIQVVALGLARYLGVVAQFWACGAAAGVVLDPLTILGATPVAQLTAAIGVTPAGLGIVEAGWAGALAWLDQPAAAITVFILAVRVLVLANFAVLSVLSRPFAARARPG